MRFFRSTAAIGIIAGVLPLFCFHASAAENRESALKSASPGEIEGRESPLNFAGGLTQKAKSEKLWAVQPLATPDVPQTGLRGNSPIDAFIQAKLKERGLASSPEADRRALIRRLTFDLHGLPPTPEEVDAFIADESADAYEKLVDRLLASPRYGERWGRHWLDVAHYAETHGYDKDSRRTNSWPYRDYVIKSFNEDKPYGRFIQEQLAGDVLFPDDPDGIVATGFIVAGPWDKVGQVELKEGTMDKKITRLLDRDDMVANAVSTFCSLTVHCARCHDHKFDPISQKDYYSLQAVFAGIDRADRPYDPDKNVFNTRLTLTREQQAKEKELAGLQAVRAQVSSAKIRDLDAELTALAERIASSARLPNAVPSLGKGYHSGLGYSPYETKWVQVDLGQQFPLDEVSLLPATVQPTNVNNNADEPKRENGAIPIPHSALRTPHSAFGFPRRFKIEVSDDPQFNHAEMIADETAADFPEPGAAPYIARKPGMSGRYIRVTATRLWRDGPKTNDWFFALGELIAISSGRDVALGAPVTALDSHDDTPDWRKENLVDGSSSSMVLFNPSPTDGYQSATATKADASKWVQLDLGEAMPIDQITLVPARSLDLSGKGGFGFPVRFRIEAGNDPEFKSAEMIADKTSADVEKPGIKPQVFPGKGVSARYVRVTATELWKQKEDNYLFALSEIQVASGQTNVARAAKVSALDSLESDRWSAQFLVDGYSSLTALTDKTRRTEGYKSAPAKKPNTLKWVQLDLGKKLPIDTIRLVPALNPESVAVPAAADQNSTNQPQVVIGTNAHTLPSTPDSFSLSPRERAGVRGKGALNHSIAYSPAVPNTPHSPLGFPLRFRIEVSNDPTFLASRTLLFETKTNFIQSRDKPFELSCDSIPTRYVRITATCLSGRRGEYALALAEAEVISDGRNVARSAPVQALDSTELPGWSAQFLTDGLDQRGFLDNTPDVLAALRRQYGWQQQLASLKAQREASVTALLDDETNQKFARVNQGLDELDARLASLPTQKLVYAAAHEFQGDGTFTPPDGPRPVCLLERGDVTKPGELMKPGALACVPNLPNEFSLANPSAEGIRRAALAHWISDPNNAITWRSIVNRVWSYHFGHGIVDTPNDFGNMGSRPTHPELLDWLAGEFLSHGQSLKWLHKQILISAAYRQTSAYHEDFVRIDSGNEYLWRMNRDRLDAESIRDAMLSICGKLDFTMGGPGYDLFEFKDDFSPHYYYEKYNPDDSKTFRRSVYRSIVRSVPDPLMETLDCADPSQSVPVRNTTITALQALTLLNNPFTVRMSEFFAERLQNLSREPVLQIDWAFRLALGRLPTPEESASFQSHAARYGLINTCRLILNSNEFMFVD